MLEYNFDGLVGPTHNYAGLSRGNLASTQHQHELAYPRAAALQGLRKMKTLSDLGIGQGVLPPLFRPHLGFLETLGFGGSPAVVLKRLASESPVLLATAYSASSMWTANAATVTAGVDTADGRLHLTAANLSSTLHRSIEHQATGRMLSAIFDDPQHFCVHPALPSQAGLADEGAANHTRLSAAGYGESGPGLHLLVYGSDPLDRHARRPAKYPARQTRLASQSIARRHGLSAERTMLVQQSPAAIDAGVFHNDVISVGNQNVLLCHEQAFVDQSAVQEQLTRRFEEVCGGPFFWCEFSSTELPLQDAVTSYLFNSQLVTRPDGGMTLVCPQDVEQTPAAKRCVDRLLSDSNPVDQVLFLDLRQSMNNGGGPACLRLRVPMTDAQRATVHAGVILTDELYSQLIDWVEKHYREQLSAEDLADPQLVTEVSAAMSELAECLALPEAILVQP